MFEGLVSSVLSSYLDQYIKNFDASTLKLSIFSGKVHLKNLKLQATALNEFDLPVVITEGHLGGLDVDIPWTSLQSSPVVANVTDLFVVCKPKRCCDYSKEMEDKIKEQIKKKALKNYETVREAKIIEQMAKKGMENEEEEETDDDGNKVSYTKKLTETIIANVQITVSNVHVRFEDNSDSENPIVIGAMMDKLHVNSTDKHWEQKFIKSAAKDKKVYKIASLENLSAYMDIERDENKLLSSQKYENQSDYVVNQMKNMLAAQGDKTYVMHPINGRAKVKLQKDKHLDIAKPRLQVDISFDDVSAALNTMQYQKALNLVDYLSGYKKYERFRHFKPALRPMDAQTRFQWWKYAYEATKETIDNSYFSMVDVLHRQKTKEKYMQLYKRSKKLPWLKRLNDKEKQEYKQIEAMTDTEDLLYFRELANKELEVEKEQHKHFVVEKKQKTSWFGSLLGSNKNSKKYSKASEDAVKLTDQQKEWLEEQFATTVEEAEKAYKLPDDFTEIRILLHVKAGTVRLVDYENQTALVEASYSDIKGVIDKQRKPIKVSMELGDFKVVDKLSKKTHFPYIAKRKTFLEHIKPLVAFDLVLNPLNTDTDIYMRADVDRLDVVLNVPLYQRIIGFFAKPKNLSIKYIQKMATTTLSSATNTASAKLLLAFQNRKMIDVEVNFNAPNFIVPTDCDDNTTKVILFNLGKFKVCSDTKQRDDYYEKFFLKMYDFNISMLTVDEFLRQDADSKVFHYKGVQFLENVNMDLSMHAGIGPLTTKQPKIKLQGNIEEIKFNVNPQNLEQLLQMANNMLTLVDDPTGRTSFNCYHHGKLNVLGPATKNAWRPFIGELRKTGHLHLFKIDGNASKPSATVNIDSMDLNLISDVTQEMVDKANDMVLATNPKSTLPEEFALSLENCFGVELPQGENVEPIRIFFQATSEKEKESWVKGLRIQLVQCKALIADAADFIEEDQEEDSEAVSKNIDEAYEEELIKAVRMQLNFNLKNLAFIIGYSNEKQIANINFGDMHFSMTARKYDQSIKMKLGNFQVEDLKTSTKILSYQKINNDQNELKNKYVAELGFNNLKRGSPLLSDSKANMNVSIKFLDNFCCIFDQYILAEYVTYGNTMKELSSILDSKKRVFKVNTFDSKAEQIKALKKPVSTQAVHVYMEYMNVTLNEDGRHFATAIMKDSEIFVKLSPSHLKIKGGITNIQLLRKVKKVQKLQEILGMRSDTKSEKRLINFSVALHRNTDSIYDKEFTGELKNIEFFFIRRFITQLQFYFMEGPLMDVLKQGSKKAAKAAMNSIKESSKNLKLIKLNVKLIHPRIILPRAATSGERIIGDLGRITIYNNPNVETIDTTTHCEKFHIELKNMDIKTVRYGLPKQSILSDANIKLELARAVANPKRLIPDFDVNVFINKTKLALTHNQYEMIFEILKLNMSDNVLQDTRKKKKDEGEGDDDTSNSPEGESKQSNKVVAKVIFMGLDMELHRDCGQTGNELAEINFSNLNVDFNQQWNGDAYAKVSLAKIDAMDHRQETKACEQFKRFIDCSGFTQQGDGVNHFVEVDFSMVNGNKFIDIELGSTQFTVIPGVILEIKDFFINQYSESLKNELQLAKKRNTMAKKKQLTVAGKVLLKSNHVFSPEHPLILSPGNSNTVIIDGNYCQIWIHGNRPAVLFKENVNVKFINCVIYADSPNVFCYPDKVETHLVNFSRLIYDTVEPPHMEDKEDDEEDEELDNDDELKYEEEEESSKGMMIVRGVLHNPTFILPEDTSDEQSRALCVKTKVNLYYEQDPNKKFSEEGNFSISSINAFLKKHNDEEYTNIIDPVSLNVTLRKEEDKPRHVNVMLSRDIQSRISYQDVLLIKKIFTDFNQEQAKKKEIFDNEEEVEKKNDAISDDEYNSDHSFNEVDSIQSEDDLLFDDPESVQDSGTIMTPAAVDDQLVDPNETKSMPSILSVVFSSKNNISVLIVDDVRGYDIPLVNLLLISPDVKANIISAKFQSISASVALSLQANYFNLSVGKWEPIVESWGGELTFYQEPTFDKDTPYNRRIQLQNNEESRMLNINVSQAMLKTLMTTAKLWKASFEAGKVISSARDPFLFRNHSGKQVTLTIKEENDRESKTFTLKGYSELPLQLSEYALVTLAIENIATSHPVTVHMDSHETIKTNSKNHIVIHTHLVGSRRLIDIRSTFMVLNETNIPWNIAVSDGKGRDVLATIEPTETLGIPVDAINQKCLCIQPADSTDYEFSKPKQSSSFLNMRKEFDRARQIICASIQPDQMSTYGSIVYINNRPNLDCELVLKTPMVLCNHMAVALDVELHDAELVTDKQSHKRFFDKRTIEVGDSIHIYQTSMKKNILAKFSIQGFKSPTLALLHSTNKPRERKTVRMYTVYDVYDRPMNLKIDYPAVNLQGHKDVCIFTPYWIVNHTTHDINLHHVNSDGSKTKSGGSFVPFTIKDKSVPVLPYTPYNHTRPQRIALSIGDGEISAPFIMNTGIENEIQMRTNDVSYKMGVHVSVGPGVFKKTKIVTIEDRYVVRNNTDLVIQLAHDNLVHVLNPKEEKPLMFSTTNRSVELDMSINGDASYSKKLALSRLGEYYHAFPHENDSVLIQCNLTLHRSSVYIDMTIPDKPPFTIKNELIDTSITISQHGSDKWYDIDPTSTMDYCFDNHHIEGRLSMKIKHKSVFTKLNINMVTSKPFEYNFFDKKIYVSIYPTGPTRNVVISYTPPKTVEAESEEEYRLYSLESSLVFSGIGISFINNHSTEIAFMSLIDIALQFNRTQNHEYFNFELGSLQIDNQSDELANIPIIFSHQPLADDKPFLFAAYTRSLSESSISMWKYANVTMECADIAVDLKLINLLLEFGRELTMTSDNEEELKALEPYLEEADNEIVSKNQTPFYFDQLQINPLTFNLTFKLDGSVESIQNEYLSNMLESIGVSLISVSNANIVLKPLILNHHFSQSRDDLQNLIISHYKRVALKPLLKTFFALDVVGNPIGLYNDVSTGVHDFFVEPIKTISTNPKDVGKSIRKGTESLFTHSMHGGFSANSKFLDSVSRGISAFTFDQDYRKNRKHRTGGRPSTLAEGFSEGRDALGKSIVGAFTGIVTKPIEGFKNDSFTGFFRGAAIGAVGVPAKPIIGVLDFISSTSDGAANQLQDRVNVRRRRFIRTFHPEDNRVVPYNEQLAYAMFLLHRIRTSFNKILYYILDSENHIVVLSDIALYCINRVPLLNPSLVWKVDLKDVHNIEYEGQNGRLTIRKEAVAPSGLFAALKKSTSDKFVVKSIPEPQYNPSQDTVMPPLATLKFMITQQRQELMQRASEMEDFKTGSTSRKSVQ